MTTFGDLGRAVQLAAPDALADVIACCLEPIGARDVLLALVDYEQTELHPVLGTEPHESRLLREPVVGTMAGRAFSHQQLVEAQRPAGFRVWVPVTERAERFGVLALTLDRLDDDVRRFCVALGLQVGQHIAASDRYTDAYHLVRRRKNMDLSAEMQWDLLPPLSFACERFAVAGLLEPAYEVGGDAFDYAANGGALEFAIVDAVGHNLRSSLLGALAIGAYRHCRRRLASLDQTAHSIDQAISDTIGGEAFLTAIIGRLDGRSGELEWLSAGHPPPLLLRADRVLGDLPCDPGLPLGMGGEWPLNRVRLEPGDRLACYTDGVVEARPDDGEPFGEERLRAALAHEAASGHRLLQVLRHTISTVAEHRGSSLADDATMLVIERLPSLHDQDVGNAQPLVGEAG